MTVGERIKQARKEKGLTQKQLGELLGVTQATIQQYETGNPKPETLKRIAKALGVPFFKLRDISDLSDDETNIIVSGLLSEYKNISVPEALIISTFRALDIEGKIYVLNTTEMTGRASGYLSSAGSKNFKDAIELLRSIKEQKKECETE